MRVSTNLTDSEKARSETSTRLTLICAQASMVSHDKQHFKLYMASTE